jgi:hypothetical protein
VKPHRVGGGNVDALRCFVRCGVGGTACGCGCWQISIHILRALDPRRILPSPVVSNPRKAAFSSKDNGSLAPFSLVRDIKRHAERTTEQISMTDSSRLNPPISTITKTVIASLVGTSLEWYDFFIYGSAAALVFPRLFFPQSDPATALLLSLASYGVAYVARPLGAVIFGHYGDKLGRKAILTTTILLMGLSTFLIGVLPTYPTVGTLAPIALVLLRFIQGIALGGEWGGAALMVTEYDPDGRRRGFLGSLVQVAVPVGLLGANGVFAVVTDALSPGSFQAWGWRIPFLLSAILVVVGYLIRRDLSETPVFERIEATQSVSAAPIADVLRTSWREILLVA